MSTELDSALKRAQALVKAGCEIRISMRQEIIRSSTVVVRSKILAPDRNIAGETSYMCMLEEEEPAEDFGNALNALTQRAARQLRDDYNIEIDSGRQ